MAKRAKAQIDALKSLNNPKIIAEYDDGSIDFEFEGQKLAMGPNASVMTPGEYMTKVYRPWQDKKGTAPKKEKKTTTPYVAFSTKTPCERDPVLCEPRVIKHIAWDADDTIWDIKPYGIASNITGPLTLLDPDTVVEEHPAYKAPDPTTTFHEPFPEEGEIQSYKYGHRYGHQFGFPAEEEPEDFFLRQIDKDIEKGNPKSHKPVADIDELKELIHETVNKTKNFGFDSTDLVEEIAKKGYEEPESKDIQEAANELVDEHFIGTHDRGFPEQRWFYTSGEEQPSETSLKVNQIVTELTEELTQEEKDKLGIVGQNVKLIHLEDTPPKEPTKKGKTTFNEPTKIYIKLMPGYRDLLDRLKEQGITSSIISLNTKGTVSRILEKFGIADHYLDIRDSWENKGKVFKNQMKNFGYKPQEGMFVDNTQSHVEDVAKSGAIPLVYGKDIKDVAQIVNYMTNA